MLIYGKLIQEQYGKILNFKGDKMKEILQEDQFVLLSIKSLLNHLDYIIKDEDRQLVDEFHTLCRKYCSWGKPNEES